MSYYLLRRLLGVKTAEGEKQCKVQKLAKGEILMLNIGSTSTGGRISAVRADLAKIVLTAPVCTAEAEKIALSRRVDKHWRCDTPARARLHGCSHTSLASCAGSLAGERSVAASP